MDHNEGMVKVDLSKAQLNPKTVEHMKVMERLAHARAQQVRRVKRNARLTCFGLASLSIGIYFYSMYAVRQEGFLDDFEEPQLKSES